MLKYNKAYLKKLEQFLIDQEYKLLYEKGHFRSGYCIVNDSKMIVINKFFDTEGKINALQEIIPQLDLNEGLFNANSRNILENISPKENTSS